MILTVLVCVLVGISSAKAASDSRTKAIICKVFGPYCNEAIRVSDCETGGTFNIWAGYNKHQYWGLFQMGNYARQRYGHGWNAWKQARAARKYFLDTGKDWSPWTCKPN